MTHHNFDDMRHAMVVSQLRTNAVTNPRLLAAMGAVPRERFVPAEKRGVAYIDAPISLADGRGINPPMTSARLIDAVDPKPGERVLLIGAATGYLAAVLAHMGCEVVAIESDPALAAMATTNIGGNGGADAGRAQIVTAPMADGAGERGAFDVLIIDGAIPALPDTLGDSLKEGGRAAFARSHGAATHLCEGVRIGGVLSAQPFVDMIAVALPEFVPPPVFSF